MADLGAIGTSREVLVYRKTDRTWSDVTKVIRVSAPLLSGFAYALPGAALPSSSVSGLVYENSVPAQRLVRVYRRDSGVLIGQAMSDVAGAFAVPLRGYTGTVFVIAFDDDALPNFNAQIYDLVTPA